MRSRHRANDAHIQVKRVRTFVFCASLGFGLIPTLGCDFLNNALLPLLYEAEPGLEDATRDLTDTLAAFPNAEGFGSRTPGGRGGDVVVVDSLAAEGPGTLREALTGGNRTILFAVGGTIVIDEDIRIEEPFVTIAGESAPAPGISIVGAGLYVETHDVILSHLHIRPGDNINGPTPDLRDAITIARDPELPDDADVGNILIDHCSLSWALDEIASTTYARVHDVTFSNCILSEGLSNSLHSEGEHSKAIIVGKGSRRVDVIRNLFAHNNDRNPLLSSDSSTLIVNNIIYNPGDFGLVHYGLEDCCEAISTIVGNRVIPGPDTPASRGYSVHITDNGSLQSSFYLADNCGGENRIRNGVVLLDSPPVEVTPLTTLSCEDLSISTLDTVGAFWWSRSIDDQRVIDDVTNGTGRIIDVPETLQALIDQPSTAHELALPEKPNEDDDGDGYTNLEEMLHRRRIGSFN